MAIIISVDSDDEEAAVRGVLAAAGLSFAIQRGRIYQGGGGNGGNGGIGWSVPPTVTIGCGPGGAAGFGGPNTADSPDGSR